MDTIMAFCPEVLSFVLVPSVSVYTFSPLYVSVLVLTASLLTHIHTPIGTKGDMLLCDKSWEFRSSARTNGHFRKLASMTLEKKDRRLAGREDDLKSTFICEIFESELTDLVGIGTEEFSWRNYIFFCHVIMGNESVFQNSCMGVYSKEVCVLSKEKNDSQMEKRTLNARKFSHELLVHEILHDLTLVGITLFHLIPCSVLRTVFIFIDIVLHSNNRCLPR